MPKYSSIFLIFLAALLSCAEGDEEISTLNIISITLDGAPVIDGDNSVSLSPNITITFDASVAPEALENSISINSANSTATFTKTFSNSNSQVTIVPELSGNTKYTFTIQPAAIGANGQVLSKPVSIELLTDNNFAAACTSASNDCYEQLSFNGGSSTYTFNYYSTFPITGEVNLEQIEQVIILVHGASRNSDEYFTWLNTTLSKLSLSRSTLLIAPYFKSESESTNQNDLHWDNNGWREGNDSNNNFKISSFAVIDTLINRVVNRANSLKRVLLTGHSSGGLFTHVYAASNKTEDKLPDTISIDYIVANSQYFYYPSDERVNENTGQLFVPSDCNGYNFWPFGFNLVPNYLSNDTEENINQQFVSRSIYYLLGNGTQSDPSLNTSDCSATLLGSTRYQRGENINSFVDKKYPDNNHSQIIVDGIGHNGQAMYQSEEFELLLSDLFML